MKISYHWLQTSESSECSVKVIRSNIHRHKAHSSSIYRSLVKVVYVFSTLGREKVKSVVIKTAV